MQRPPDDVASGRAPNPDSPLEPTQIYDVLSNERRTRVLDLLAEDEPRELSTLAELIAADETGERPPPRKKRTSVYVTLHQTHLPKLDDLDVVEYDDREKVVSLGERADAVLARQGDGTDDESTAAGREWARGYLAVVVGGLGLTGASHVGLPGLATVSAGAYAATTLVVLLALLAYRVGREGALLGDLGSSRQD